MNIERAVNLDDLRRLAQRSLPKIAFDFIEGGADDELCLQRNRQSFERYQLLPRYLRDVSDRDLGVTLFGRRYSLPFGISPTGLAGLFWPDADLLLAAAAEECNVPFLLSSAANASIEETAEIAKEHVWFQMYCTRDPRINADLVRRANAAGVKVLVISVDVPVNSNRERNKRNGFSRPFRMTPQIAWQALGHPLWVLRYLRTGGIPMMRNWQPYAKPNATAAEVADLYGTLTPAPMITWDDVRTIRRTWPGALVIKGLLHPGDVEMAARLGADGVVVSNHGGRQLDKAPAPVEVLSEIRTVAAGRLQIILDSGVRRGSDAAIARCLGADAVLFGRPTLFGVAAAGKPGVLRALQIMRSEVDAVLAQIGCGKFSELGEQYLWTCQADRPSRIFSNVAPELRRVSSHR